MQLTSISRALQFRRLAVMAADPRTTFVAARPSRCPAAAPTSAYSARARTDRQRHRHRQLHRRQ